MPPVALTDYDVQWSIPQKTGTVQVRSGGSPVHTLPMNSAAEFIAVLFMLSKRPVTFDPDTGVLNCGPRPTGT